MVFLDEREAVVVYVSFGTIAAVVVFDGEDDFSFAVDNAPLAVKGDIGTVVFKETCLVVLAGDDFATFLVEVSIFIVTHDKDTTFGLADKVGVDGFCELAEVVVVHRQTIVVASKDSPFIHGGKYFVLNGEHLFVLAVNHTVTVKFFDHGKALVEGEGVVVLGGDDGVAVVVDESILNKGAVDVDTHYGKAFVERRCRSIAEGDALDAEGVEETIQSIVDYHNHAVGGVVYIVVDAGDYLLTVAVDKAAAVVVGIHFAIIAMKMVDKHVFVGDNDGAVFAFESETVAVLGGLNTVDKDKFATTFFVVDILYLLLRTKGEQD